MRKLAVSTFFALLMGMLAAVSCRQSDVRTALIHVPNVQNSMDIRIVTNAALDEVVARYDGIKNNCEIDLSQRTVLYHEGQRLLEQDYRDRIRNCIAEVGFNPKLLGMRHNPPPPVPTDKGPYQLWPDRFTLSIFVPDMECRTDANIVVDAIAHARLGRDDPRISLDRKGQRLTVQYQSLLLSIRNIEEAIAAVGYDANRVPALHGRRDALPHGWKPVRL